jgi:hypothetical protein
MPPAKPRTAPDDSRSEASSTREKLGNVVGLAVNGKTRRVASGLGMNSSLRGVAAQDATVGVNLQNASYCRCKTNNTLDAMVNA